MEHHMNGTFKIAALAALMTSAAAFAEEPTPAPAQPESSQTTTSTTEQTKTTTDTTMATESAWPEFTTLDVNGDGYVSKDEAKSNAALTAAWADLDADKNGSLSSAEYAKAKDMNKDKPKQ
jgi:hypothetical protein